MRRSTAIVEFVTRYSPWLAPVPTATAIYRAGILHLAWPWPVALAAGLLVEGLGMATAELALDMRSFNRDRGSAAAAPTWLAVITALFYLVTAVLLAVLIDVIPGLVRWVSAIFPLIGLTGYVTLALRKDHDRRLQAASDRLMVDQEYERRERDLALENRRLDADARRQIRLLRASRPASKASIQSAASQQVSFACEHCQHAFASVQALNAHQRAHISKNGYKRSDEPVSVETPEPPELPY